MIAEKLRSFKLEIRRRSHNKKIEKIRYFNWLHSGVYNEEIQELLFHIGACKLSETLPSMSFLRALYAFIEDNGKNWNIKLLFWQQLSQLDFFSNICTKVEDAQIISAFSHLILIDMAQNNDKIEGQQCKETFQDVYGRIFQKSWGSIMFYMIDTVHQLIFKVGKISELPIINRLFSQIKQLMKIAEKLNIRENLSKSFLKSSKNPQLKIIGYIQSICYFYQQNLNLIPSDQINKYLFPLLYLNRLLVLIGQSCLYSPGDQFKRTKQQLDYKVMKLLLWIIQISEPLQMQDSEIMLKILNLSYLSCPSFLTIVQTIIGNILSPNKTSTPPKLGENQSYQIQCLELLHKISYEYQWLCYQHIRKIILSLLYRLQVGYEIEIQSSRNIFQSEYFRYQVICGKNKGYHFQISLIKLLNNLISNQYTHSCSFDYYTALEQVAQDLLLVGVLDLWCLNQKICEYLQHLLILLLNLKNQGLKIRVIKSCSVMILGGKGRIKQELLRKIRLYCKLYGIDDNIEDFGFQYQQYLSTNDLSDENSSQRDQKQFSDL